MQMQSGSWQVVKVGGSLFDLPDLPRRLTTWLASQQVARQVLVAGGGRFADLVRDADARFKIGDEFGHWLCVELLDSTAALLHRILPTAQLLQWEELDAFATQTATRVGVLKLQSFLQEVEPQLVGMPLARNWATTTDAIAARVATALRAAELVLIKSNGLSPATTRQEAAEQGYVDPEFPSAAAQIPVRWVDLRANPCREGTLG